MYICYFLLSCFHLSWWFVELRKKTFQSHSKLHFHRFDIDSAIDSWFKNESICFLLIWRKNDRWAVSSKKTSFCYASIVYMNVKENRQWRDMTMRFSRSSRWICEAHYDWISRLCSWFSCSWNQYESLRFVDENHWLSEVCIRIDRNDDYLDDFIQMLSFHVGTFDSNVRDRWSDIVHYSMVSAIFELFMNDWCLSLSTELHQSFSWSSLACILFDMSMQREAEAPSIWGRPKTPTCCDIIFCRCVDDTIL